MRILVLLVLSEFLFFSTDAKTCRAGQTRIKLLASQPISAACLPPSDDPTGQAVFECTRAWHVIYADCQIRLSPVRQTSTAGLPCRFFTSTGNITGPHTAHIQAEVNTPALLTFLQQHPDVAARLSGNTSSPLPYPQLAKSLALPLRALFSSHPWPTSTSTIAKPALTLDSGTTTLPPKPQLTKTTAPTEQSSKPNPEAHRAQRAGRRVLATDLSQRSSNSAASQQHSISAAAHPGVLQGVAVQGSRQHTNKVAGLPTERGSGGSAVDGSLMSRKHAHVQMTAANGCMFVYKVDPSSDFLAPVPPPPLPTAGAWAPVVACLAGAAMMAVSVAWFAAARAYAARQDEIAEQLLQQQIEEQRAATAAMIALAHSRSLARHSCGSASSSFSGGSSSGGGTAGGAGAGGPSDDGQPGTAGSHVAGFGSATGRTVEAAAGAVDG